MADFVYNACGTTKLRLNNLSNGLSDIRLQLNNIIVYRFINNFYLYKNLLHSFLYDKQFIVLEKVDKCFKNVIIH